MTASLKDQLDETKRTIQAVDARLHVQHKHGRQITHSAMAVLLSLICVFSFGSVLEFARSSVTETTTVFSISTTVTTSTRTSMFSNILAIPTIANESTLDTGSWAGYASYGPTGSVASISATFQVPMISCPTHADNSAVAVWAGIGGSDIEQAGVEAQCVNEIPQYWSVYEFYPNQPVTVNSTLPVGPDEIIQITVMYLNSEFTVFMRNVTTDKSIMIPYTPTTPPTRSSGECVVERITPSSGALPLANFGSLTFKSCTVQAASLAYTAQINMVNLQGQYLAQVVLGTQNNFVVVWEQAE